MNRVAGHLAKPVAMPPRTALEPAPPPLAPRFQAISEMIARAGAAGHLALQSAVRKDNGQAVGVLTVALPSENGEGLDIYPIAEVLPPDGGNRYYNPVAGPDAELN